MRRKKLIIIFSVVLFVVLLIGTLMFVFNVELKTVEGNSAVSAEKVTEDLASSFMDKNVITSKIKNLFSSKTPVYANGVEITYPARNEIHIKIDEKKIVAGISYLNQYIYFDSEGLVMASTAEPMEDVPIFLTETVTTFSMYEKVQMEDSDVLNRIMNLSGLFRHYNVEWDKAEFDSDNAVMLYTGDLKVLLGKKDNYDDSISALSDVLKTALKKNMKGEIDMRNYKIKGDIIIKNAR